MLEAYGCLGKGNELSRRTQLQSVINDFAHWCISRNHDLNGYWAIGQLYACATKSNSSILDLQIFPKIEYQNVRINILLNDYRQFIKNNLIAKNIPAAWLAKLNMTLQFDDTFDMRLHYFRSALGRPVTCHIRLETDLGRVFYAKQGGNCWIHDPKREMKRYE